MSRLMSVAMTTDAVIQRRKTVTRRKGWWDDKNGRRILKVGDTLTLCKKVQGRKPGELIERLAEVEVVSIRREALLAMLPTIGGASLASPSSILRNAYGYEEVKREGFPNMHPAEFVQRFFIDAQGIGPLEEVTRIEWRYLDEGDRT